MNEVDIEMQLRQLVISRLHIPWLQNLQLLAVLLVHLLEIWLQYLQLSVAVTIKWDIFIFSQKY